MTTHSCPGCKRLRDHVRAKYGKEVSVKTWCRVCHEPVPLRVSPVYRRAVEWAFAVDDSAAEHEFHSEPGGWGVHWRLDDVLRFVFPKEHVEDLFPMPSWYPFHMEWEPAVERIGIFDESRYLGPKRQHMSTLTHSLQGKTWTEEEARRDFIFLGWNTPFVVVRRRSDGAVGRLIFQKDPLLYIGFSQEKVL